VMMQIVTNVIGPRVMGSAVGIHPLEAMAAAFIGFPLAGVLGAFFAVPIVGFLHVALGHAYREFVTNSKSHSAAAIGAAPTNRLPVGDPASEPAGPSLGEQDASA